MQYWIGWKEKIHILFVYI